MAIFSTIILIIWWLLACYGLIIEKAPDMKDEFDKIIPYQWIVWVILIIFWIRDIFSIGTMIRVLQSNAFFWIMSLLSMVTKLVLWFVLSFWLLTKYVFSTAKTTKKPRRKSTKTTKAKSKTKSTVKTTDTATREDRTTSLYQTLKLVQVPFGIIAIIVGIIALFVMIYFAIF